MCNSENRFNIEEVTKMIRKQKFSYMHFTHKNDNEVYLCDWYRYWNGKFYCFSDGGIHVKIFGTNEFKRTVAYEGKRVEGLKPTQGVIISTVSSTGGYDQFVGITEEFDCIEAMLED